MFKEIVQDLVGDEFDKVILADPASK